MIDQGYVIELLRELELGSSGSGAEAARSFRDNGIDSLDVMTLLLALEERTGVKLGDEEVATIGSIGDLVAAVNRRLAARP